MKLTVIGGGGVRSMILAKSLAQHALELSIDEIVFMDNNEKKLGIYGELARQTAIRIAPDIKFSLTTDPVEAVKDANYVITTIRVGEDKKRIDDEKIALNEGVLGQETTGAAGLSFAMRSVPALAEYCELIRRYSSSEVKIFNFTNPAGVVSQTLRDMGYDFTYGICDAPTGMLRGVAKLYGVKQETVTASCYGLNHLSFFNSIKFGEKEMLPTLLEDDRVYKETDMRFFSKEAARKFGCALNEYLYYFLYREKAVANVLSAGITRGEVIRNVNCCMIEELEKLDPVKDFEECLNVYVKWHGKRSAMYMKNESGVSRPDTFSFDLKSKDDGGYAGVALQYIRAKQTGKKTEMIFCVPNNGAIPGLKDTDVVEISCTVMPDGTYIPHVDKEPEELSMELIRRVKIYERYASRAIRTKSKDDAVTCLMMHPLVNSYSLAEKLVEEYIRSNQEYIRGWN
ncbi:6-phospho-beta-glucosidase [Mediterraneibacter sp. NSJ-55]|uniref:6-phospho-beta-glucosidase n=1 Tax=Mediterraneibacter hominis TaxID=2763054 RepID=A0A923RQ37_9FIRM|nr:6-phospho-beta-glucosidase [Mediterraneibacter hominis]MBC5689115.1 6-phospho-beta-glucosidase [Mediterraneibacter hominis]